MCYKVLLYVSCRAWPAVNPTTPPRSKPAHRPWWLPPSRTCPACWCGWWCWCWAGRPRWGGWRWRRATAAGSAGSTSTPAGWPGSRGWSCWAPRRSCGRGWSLEEEKGRGDSLSVRTRGSGNWGCNSYGNNGVLCNKEDALGLLKNFFFPCLFSSLCSYSVLSGPTLYHGWNTCTCWATLRPAFIRHSPATLN